MRFCLCKRFDDSRVIAAKKSDRIHVILVGTVDIINQINRSLFLYPFNIWDQREKWLILRVIHLIVFKESEMSPVSSLSSTQECHFDDFLPHPNFLKVHNSVINCSRFLSNLIEATWYCFDQHMSVVDLGGARVISVPPPHQLNFLMYMQF